MLLAISALEAKPFASRCKMVELTQEEALALAEALEVWHVGDANSGEASMLRAANPTLYRAQRKLWFAYHEAND